MADYEKDIQGLLIVMGELSDDNTVPRNIRKAVNDAREKLRDRAAEPVVRASSAIYILDEISNDINMPMHARTEIWNVISVLSKIK